MIIQYTPEAIQDLARLREFIGVKNPLAAKRIGENILAGIEKLKPFPKIGLAVQHATEPDKVRDLYVGNYTVRYLVGENLIYILRIWHGKEIEKDL